MGRTQSKWMSSLAKQNYKYFSEKLIALDTKKKLRALRMMRMRMKTRFMMVYRLFRLKKYGEPIGPAIMRPRKKRLENAPLDVVHEHDEEDLERDNQSKVDPTVL